MKIVTKRITITGRHIMIAAAAISLLCSVYWFYRTVFEHDVQWLSFGMTLTIGIGLIFLARHKR